MFLLFLAFVHRADAFGFDTRNILEDVASSYLPEKSISGSGSGYIIGRSGGACYGDLTMETVQAEQTNDFLDVVNLMEYVQLASSEGRNTDFMNFYEMSKSAMEFGNTYMAQEHMARAMKTLESARRKKRDTDIWDAGTLFDRFREEMGEEKFKNLLHLDKKVTMAFAIDTSSSMSNDMEQVKQFIAQLVLEQEKHGLKTEYILTTFSDPYSFGPFTYQDRQEFLRKLEYLRPNIGGDCEEMTCHGILKAITNQKFMTVGNSVLYVFTDAASKDCVRQHPSISMMLQYFKAPAFFFLLGTCKPEQADNYYVSISDKSGGFTLLIQQNGVYNITDTINGYFDKHSLIIGEENDNAVLGQGVKSRRRKREAEDLSEGDYEERGFLIDTSVERFTVYVTATPISVLSQVKLVKPVDGDKELCGNLMDGLENMVEKVSRADDALVIDVSPLSCQCTGTWTLKYPKDADQFNFRVQSSGTYLVDFEAYFVDSVESVMDVANYSPCLGIEENLVIKLNQGEKVKTDTLIAKIVSRSGKVVYWQGELEKDSRGNNAFVVPLTIPSDIGRDGFKVVLEGDIVDGTRFQRFSTNIFYPASSCLRVMWVGNYYALTPNKKTFIRLKVTNNNDFAEEYLLTCSNSMSYPLNIGGPAATYNKQGQRVNRPYSNPVLLDAGFSAVYLVNIAAPSSSKIVKGRTVPVTCKVTTSTEELIDIIMLTEMERGL